jgi:hypothetical protein
MTSLSHDRREAGAAAANDDLPEGMIDYATRCAIRDQIRVDGFEAAREKIAFMLEAEAGRRLS